MCVLWQLEVTPTAKIFPLFRLFNEKSSSFLGWVLFCLWSVLGRELSEAAQHQVSTQQVRAPTSPRMEQTFS